MKKKLLIVAHHLTIGGVQKSLISTLKVLDYEKYDVTLYLRKNRTDLLPYVDDRVNVIINNDATHYYRRPYPIILQLLEFIFKLLKLNKLKERFSNLIYNYIVNVPMIYEYKNYFKNKKFDIALSYVQGYEALFVANFINADKKFVYFHTSTNDLPEIHNKILHEFDLIISEHNEQAKLISSWYPVHTEKIRILSNYVDTEFITKQSQGLTVEDEVHSLILCSCGRLSGVKGFDLAVEAANILKSKGYNFKWYIVGDGPERPRIETLIKKYDLQTSVILVGMQLNPYPYMANCDIYVQPSYEESQGITMLEALRLNKPVISTATVGGTKLIENGVNGLLSGINCESLADKINQLYNDKDLYNQIINNLTNIDYSNEFNEFRENWSTILGE